MRWWVLGAMLWLAGASMPAQGADIAGLERVRDAPAVPLTREAVAHLPESAFVRTDDAHRLVGHGGGRGWWRLQPAAASGERLLLVYHPYSARVTVLASPGGRAATQTVFDRARDPRYSRRALVFPIGSDVVHIGVEGARYPLRIAIEDAGVHAVNDLNHTRVLSTMVGILVGVSLLTSLFWLMLRERVYLLYAASMLMQVLYLLCAYGEAYALPGLRELGQVRRCRRVVRGDAVDGAERVLPARLRRAARTRAAAVPCADVDRRLPAAGIAGAAGVAVAGGQGLVPDDRQPAAARRQRTGADHAVRSPGGAADVTPASC